MKEVQTALRKVETPIEVHHQEEYKKHVNECPHLRFRTVIKREAWKCRGCGLLRSGQSENISRHK